MNNDNKAIIADLEEAHRLLQEALQLNAYVESGHMTELKEKATALKAQDGGLTAIPYVFTHMPIFPTMDMNVYTAQKKEYEKKQGLFRIVLIVTVAAVALYFLLLWPILSTVSTVGIMATIIIAILKSGAKKKYTELKEKHDRQMKQYSDSMEAYRSSLVEYEQERERGIAAAKEYGAQYRENYEAYVALLEEASNKKAEAMQGFIDRMEKVQAYEFIPSDYYHLLPEIIKMLKSGRADDYKEALNLAIAEEREAEAEAARRAEDARRTQIMQQQAAEQERRNREMERHNQEMERQQRMHDQEMERQAKAQNRELQRQGHEARYQAEQQRRDAAHQANASRLAGVSKCASCANSKHCPSHVKNSGGGLGCGGYRPYGA